MRLDGIRRSRNEEYIFQSRNKVLLFKRNCHEGVLLLKRDGLAFAASKEGKCWRLDDLIEESGAPDKERETNNLQPFERLPAEPEAHKPDEQGATGVDG